MRTITWNIKVDSRFLPRSWLRRRSLLCEVIRRERPDMLSLQEAQKHQLEFLADGLGEAYAYVGVGRKDGKEEGEFCPIFYRLNAISLIESGTFWLSTTPERPSCGFDIYPRICTWGEFREARTGRPFRLFNVHLPLAPNFWGKRKALRVLLGKIQATQPLPTILTGDLNSGPSSWVWREIYAAGFQHIPNPQPTSLLSGIPPLCIDAVFISAGWTTRRYERLMDHQGRLYPSDHFGVVAEIDM